MRILTFLILFLTAFTCLAHEDHPKVAKITAKEQHRPSVLPDRIILTWAGDPRFSQDVSWRTDSTVKEAFVEFAVATKGPYFAHNALRVNASTSGFESDLGGYHLHTAQMKPLAPATKYAYRVGDGNNWSEWFHFRTASQHPAPFTFVYFGDAQNNIRSMWSRIIREAQSDAPKAAFLLHAGDLINSANLDSDWGEWFGGGHWLNAMIPSIATPGNHEYAKIPIEGTEEERRELSKHWQPTFAFPQNGPDGVKESAYWIDYQGTRIISLNSNEKTQIQAKWLEEVLKDNPNDWTILTFHHPMYSSAAGRDNVDLRKLWKPIFDKHQVDLVLQGHDHSYARTGLKLPPVLENLDTGLRLKDGPTVYVVSVSGPKQYDVGKREFFQRTASGAQLYQVIRVEKNQLTYEARVANGELYDSFVIKKRPGKPNQLIDRIPNIPESRKPTPTPTIESPVNDSDIATAIKNGDKQRILGWGAARVFASLDEDQNDKISGSEIVDEMKSYLTSIDTNKDNVVTVTELEAFFKQLETSK